MRDLRGVIGALAVTLLFWSTASADELDVLSGKTIRFIIGSAPTSGTSKYARPFAEELQKLLPNTTIRIQSIDGVGSAVALSETYLAKGEVITLVAGQYSPIYAQMLGREVARFDLNQFHWIGALTNNQRTVAVRSSLNMTFADLLASGRTPVVLLDDSGSPGNIEMRLIAAVSGLKLNIVPGVEDEQRLAMLMAGDADMVVNSFYQLTTIVASGELTPILRYGRDGYPPELQAVPTVADAAPPEAPKELLRLLESVDKIGRPIAAAPATSPEIVEALRVAFDRIVESPALMAEYERQDLFLSPTSGKEIGERINDLLGRAETVEILKKYLDCSDRLSAGSVQNCN
jgi:tripartite-type tricarboxylate transporter receptor subunit TctC